MNDMIASNMPHALRSNYLGYLGHIGQSLTFFFGGVTIILAGLALILDIFPRDVFLWAVSTLGLTYILITASVVLLSLFSLSQYRADPLHNQQWIKIGSQSNTAIATIALTYTLCGISLGVGSLASSDLSPENINHVISGLTKEFGMAFMTSVVGLPLSALMRFIFVLNDTTSRDPSLIPS